MIKRWGLLFLAFIVCASLSAKTITVTKKGQITSIEKALSVALDGDTIDVKGGVYFEKALMIRQSIYISTSENATIDAENNAEDIFIVRADNVTISGFNLINVGVSFLKEATAIRLVHCKNARIDNNRILTCFFGIYLEKAEDSFILNNEIIGKFKDEASAGNAIHAWKGNNLIIENNSTTGHRDGIYFEFVDNSSIVNNISEKNLRYGLHFMFSNDDEYKRNIFKDNGAGVAVMFSKNITMIENQFVHNWGGASYGLLLKEISDGRIESNEFIENTIGILAEGANRISMINNHFLLNGTALDIKGNCLDNKILQNNFIANTFEVVTNSKHNNNLFSENYWSNYSGYDLDRDGFGDFSYRPVNLFAKVTHEVPSATFLIHSPFVRLMEIGEKIFPQYIPKALVDERPKITPYD